jgi:hypothetical protein
MQIFIAFLTIVLFPAFAWSDDGRGLYIRHCSSCHHHERYGLKAPPLIPEFLKRYKREEIAGVIKDGLPSTKMPSYNRILEDKEIEKIVSYITSPVENVRWDMKDISESKEMYTESSPEGLYSLMREYGITESKPRRYVESLDLENIILIVESGRGITVMDGQDFKILDRFETGAIHGGPKFSYSLKLVYAQSRDGVITLYDLHNLKKIGRVRAGINTRNITLSHDDRFIAVANYLPNNITILDADLNPKEIINVEGRIGGIYTLPSSEKFICSFRDTPELWLIDYKGGFKVERLSVPEPFEDITISPFEDIVIGASRKGTGIYIYSLKTHEVVSSFETEGMPHLSSATYWTADGVLYAAINHLKRPAVTILDLKALKVVNEINLSGTGFFVRTHQDTPYLWADTETEVIQIIDKTTLQAVKTLTPSNGKKAMHIEFTKDGRFAMVSIPDEDGAVVIYDAFNLNEIMRIPFKRPSGKYNALNKTYPGRVIQAYGHALRVTTIAAGH